MVRSWLKKLKKKRNFKSSDFSATSGEESALEDDNSVEQSPYFTSKRSHRTATNNEHTQSPFGNVINLKDHFKKFSSDAEDEFSEDDPQFGYNCLEDFSTESESSVSMKSTLNCDGKNELDSLIDESGRLLKEGKDFNGEVTSLENVELFDDSMLLAFQDGQLSFQDFLVTSPKHDTATANNNNFFREENKVYVEPVLEPPAVVEKSDDFEDEGEETERYESGDDSSLDEYSGVKSVADKVASSSSLSSLTQISEVLPETSLPGSERTNAFGTPYPEQLIPQSDVNESDMLDSISNSSSSLVPNKTIVPGASLEKLAQEMFSDDTLQFALKSDLFDHDDYPLSVSQQDINTTTAQRHPTSMATKEFSGQLASKLKDLAPSYKTKAKEHDNSDSDASDESEHTIVNTNQGDNGDDERQRAVTDRKALKSMPNFPPSQDILGQSVSDKKSDSIDLRSKSADPAPRHSCDSPSVAQREVCIIEDKIISAPGSYTRLLSNDEDTVSRTSLEGTKDKSRSNTDPWLSYLPKWKQSPVIGGNQSNGRTSRGYASQTSSYLTEGNGTDSDFSAVSGRVSISSEYSTTSGADTSSADERSLRGGLEIDFYLPPPPPIDEDYIESDREFLLDASPFNLDWDYEQSDSPTLTPSSSVIFLGRQRGRSSDLSSGAEDPISENLLAMLPVPEDNFQPVMSQAIGEIITEIIASRQKFAKLSRQLDAHEKLLKEHGQQIQKQNREINELRRPRENRHPEKATRTSGHDRIKRRTASVGKLVGKNNTRRSRELCDLSCTLDRLLFQCYTLQKNSKAEKETHLYQPLTGAGRRNGRRRTPCEDRIKTKKVKALLLRSVPTVPVHYSQIIPPTKAILKTFNLVSEGIRKADSI